MSVILGTELSEREMRTIKGVVLGLMGVEVLVIMTRWRSVWKCEGG